MFSRSAVAIFSVMVAEFFVGAWMIDRIGFGSTLLLVLALVVLGVAIVRWKSAGLLLSTIQSATNRSADAASGVAGRAIGLFAGVLIAIPGFVTSAIGLLLLVAPVRKVVEPILAARAATWSMPFVNRTGTGPHRTGTMHGSGGTIIDVDLVDRESSGPGGADDDVDVSRSARPEIG